MIKRRRFIQCAGLGSFALAFSAQDKLTNAKFFGSNSLDPKNLQIFEYEAPTVNKKGQLTGFKKLKNKYFSEDLDQGKAIEMVAVSSGKFKMGASRAEHLARVQEMPHHPVSIPAYFISKFPITQVQWAAVAALPKVKRELDPYPSHFQGANRPVECVSWLEAEEFCIRLSHKTGRTYQLPSEAQWEYACRAGTRTPFSTGATITSQFADYVGTYAYAGEAKGDYRRQTQDVGSFAPNQFGLHDLHGNVWEWCADCWHDTYHGAPQRGQAWQARGQIRSIRGGGWLDSPDKIRSSSRSGYDQNALNRTIGFRISTVLS